MILQDSTKQAEFDQLIEALNTNNKAFYELQDQLVEIDNNLSRNKKLIEALEEDSRQAQAEIELLEVSNTGEINFNGFDELSERISKNAHKIEVVNKVIEKFSAQIKLLLITEYKTLSENSVKLACKCFSIIADDLLNSFLNGDSMNKIKEIYSTLLASRNELLFSNNILGQPKEAFIGFLSGKIKQGLNEEINLDHFNIHTPEMKFSIPNISGGNFQRAEYIEELSLKANGDY